MVWRSGTQHGRQPSVSRYSRRTRSTHRVHVVVDLFLDAQHGLRRPHPARHAGTAAHGIHMRVRGVGEKRREMVRRRRGMSAVRHTFKCNFRPYTAFRSDVVSSVRTALRLTDMIDEARQNKEGRLPYTVGIMMQGSRDKAADSDDALGTHHDDGHHGVGDVTDVDIFVKGKATPSSTDTRRRREEEQKPTSSSWRPCALRCRARSKTDIQEARGSDLRVRG